MHELKIQITGSGESAVTKILADLLRRRGASVVVSDHDHSQYTIDEANARLATLTARGQLHVTITTAEVARRRLEARICQSCRRLTSDLDAKYRKFNAGRCACGGQLAIDLPPPSQRTLRDHVAATTSDLVTRMLGDEENEDLPRGAIDRAIREGEITVGEIVDLFREELERGVRRA